MHVGEAVWWQWCMSQEPCDDCDACHRNRVMTVMHVTGTVWWLWCMSQEQCDDCDACHRNSVMAVMHITGTVWWIGCMSQEQCYDDRDCKLHERCCSSPCAPTRVCTAALNGLPSPPTPTLPPTPSPQRPWELLFVVTFFNSEWIFAYKHVNLTNFIVHD